MYQTIPRTTKAQDPAKELLQQIKQASAGRDSISLDALLDCIGRRSFGPIILAVGAFLTVPGPSDIPTVPSIFGILITIIGGQIILGREHIWLPRWILRKTIKTKRLEAAIQRLDKPARYIDTLTKPRLHLLTAKAGTNIAAGACIGLALLTPIMEFVPLSANVAGVAFVFFGLGFVARDGLMHLLGFSFCGLLVSISVWVFLI